jgi:predicted DNA-binding transcriptional regulator AlpA
MTERQTGFAREPECKAFSGYSNMQRRRLEDEGKFPKRRKLNPTGGKYGAVGWGWDELYKWYDERLASRDTESK